MRTRPIYIAVIALLVVAGCDCYPDHSLIVNSTDALVETTYGTLCGYIEDGIYTFKGIQYARAERFMPPQDPEPWEGVQTALYYGHQCHQAPRLTWEDDCEAFLYQWDDGVQSDDCQYLNVWTGGINDGKKRPVMVWLHGGGYAMGASSELPFYDGANLARKGVVLVSINHRLNLLGFMDLSDFGEKYKYSGVTGVMDMVKALEWVKKNIGAFGGDPDNVTIFGQSGGGGKVNILMGTPSAKGLFNKGIIESGSMLSLAQPEESREMGRLTAAKLGLTEKTIDEIQTIPYDKLLAAATDAILEKFPDNIFYRLYGAGMWFQPTLDGEILPYTLDDPRVAEISKGLPTIIGCNFAENNMLPAVYHNADFRYQMGDTKQYLYVFAKPSPHMDGTFGTNHCTEMPFVFNNIWLGRYMVGADKSAYKLADLMSDVWVSFAKDGCPDVKKLKWEVYNPDTKPMVVFNDKTVTVHAGDAFFEEMAAYKPERWVYRQPWW
jgi:para-nitrobenzyl esterase